MKPKVCPNCSASNRAGAKFCASCGLALPSPAPSGPIYLQPGVVLENRYQIVRMLGKGGFGAVYLAENTRLQRECVVKQMLLPDRNQYATTKAWQNEVNMLRSNFSREARSLIALNKPGHPNIPEIYDSFDDLSGNYLVMKYIEGESLEQRLTRLAQPLPWREAVEMVIQVASALEYMHSRTDPRGKSAPVLHRDIKPANILVDKSGRVWLVDFGLSKAEPATARLVQGGTTTAAGTPGYAPIEQWLQQAVPASDVYSLSATLHHLVTGRDPSSVFTSFDLAALQQQHANFPAIRRLDKRLPAPLEAAIAATLRDKSQHRPSIKQWKGQLERILRPQTTAPLFRWQDGTLSQQPEELVQPADLHWDEARGYFTNGNWERWFKDIHHNQALTQMKAAKAQHKNDDVALDAFLRTLDHAFPPPHLQTNVCSLYFGYVPWQEKQTLELELRNVGSGCLHGRITNQLEWVQVDSDEFGTHEQETINVTVDTQHLLPRAKPYAAALTIEDSRSGQTQIPLSVKVPKPQLFLTQDELDLGSSYHGTTKRGTFTVKNIGGSFFECKVESNAAWLIVEPANFRCQPGQSKEVQVEVHVDAGKFPAASTPYSATLLIDAALGGQKQMMVKLRVPKAHLHLIPDHLNLKIPYEEKTATASLILHNSGASPLNGTIHCDATWVALGSSQSLLGAFLNFFRDRKSIDFSCEPGKETKIQLKLTVAEQLTPRAKPYTAQLVIDAGTAAQTSVPITVLVPEPRLEINPQKLILKQSSQNATGTFIVRNIGGSECHAELDCDATWITVQPVSFDCKPGESTEVEVKADTSQMTSDENSTEVRIRAHTDGWQQTEKIIVKLPLGCWQLLIIAFALGGTLAFTFGSLLLAIWNGD